MTDTLRTATDRAKGGPLADAAQSAAADRLKAEVQEYLAVQAQRLLVGVGHKAGETTLRLNDIAEGRSPGLARLALDGGRKLAEGKGPMRSALELGAGRARDSAIDAFKNLTGGKGRRKDGVRRKPTVIMESVDVGVPVRTAYGQWTQWQDQDFSTFAKGVESANRADDDRISWTSKGAEGTTKGVVSFHPLADNLTRVLLVVEYRPKGLFERTGSLWRAQGRRARLDLKNFARYASLEDEAAASGKRR